MRVCLLSQEFSHSNVGTQVPLHHVFPLITLQVLCYIDPDNLGNSYIIHSAGIDEVLGFHFLAGVVIETHKKMFMC